MKKSLLLVGLSLAILLAGIASYAVAAPPTTATDNVTVNATVQAKITLTLDKHTVNFGAVEPGVAPATQAVQLTVSSNKAYDVSCVTSGQSGLMGLSTTLGNSTGNAKTASQNYNDTYSLNVPWTTDPGAYTANVQYTVTQN